MCSLFAGGTWTEIVTKNRPKQLSNITGRLRLHVQIKRLASWNNTFWCVTIVIVSLMSLLVLMINKLTGNILSISLSVSTCTYLNQTIMTNNYTWNGAGCSAVLRAICLFYLKLVVLTFSSRIFSIFDWRIFSLR